MAAIITAVPVIIDPINGASDFYREILPYGKYMTGTAAYQVLSSPYSRDPPTGFPTSIRMYKSTDAGATWAEQDTANRPVTSGLGLFTYCSTFDDRYIYVVYAIQTGAGPFVANLFLQIFDTQTDTWGAPGTPSTGDGSQWAGLQTSLVKLSDGSLRLYTGGDGIKNVGGVWDASATTFDVHSQDTLGALVQANDNIHYVTTRGYYLLDPSFAVIATNLTIPGTDGVRVDMLFPDPDSIAISFTSRSHDQTVAVSIGTPLSGPTFTTQTVSTATPGVETITYSNLCMDSGAKIHLVSVENGGIFTDSENFAMALSDPTPADTGKLTVRWILSSQSGTPPTKLQIWQSKLTGSTWGTPELYYDLLDNPPTGFDPTINLTFLETGQALYGSTTPPPAQTLQLNKEVSGGTASPSDWTLTAVGNDSPATVLTGLGPQVGPTSVPAITFDLSESSGLTWDEATRTWDEATDTWNGDYVAGSWVCTGGGSMPNDHTIIIPEGANIVCTIINTFSPPNPPPPPPHPGTDVQFELRRVYASMKPAPRIPIRGGS